MVVTPPSGRVEVMVVLLSELLRLEEEVAGEILVSGWT